MSEILTAPSIAASVEAAESFREAILDFSSHAKVNGTELHAIAHELFYHGTDMRPADRERKLASLRTMMAELNSSFSLVERACAAPTQNDVVSRIRAVTR